MITPENAGKLLEQVVYDRVLAFVDLIGLQQFEQDLEFALIDVGVDYDEVPQVAKEMIDAALHRLSEDHDVRRVIGMPPFADCELCEEEARLRSDANGSPR